MTADTYWKVPFERIFCDTPTDNEPMIHPFGSEGWLRLPEHERPIGDPFLGDNREAANGPSRT